MLTAGSKILFITQYAGFIGGLERYVYAVASLLRENGLRPFLLYVEETRDANIFCSTFEKCWNISEMEAINESDFDLTNMHKISDPENIKKILQRFQPVLTVHDHDYYCPKGYRYFPYKRKNCNRAFQTLFCGICSSIVPPRHLKNGCMAMLKKNFLEAPALFHEAMQCRHFIVLSEFMKSCLTTNGIAPEKITILHPFLQKDAPEKVRSSDTRKEKLASIVFAGQMVMSKGIPLLLEAFSRLKSHAHLHILGDGGRIGYFQNLAKEMLPQNNFTFHGWVQNPADFFSTADVVVFPSMWQEPFGLSGIEAMSHGVPVVAFDVGGVSEWLKDGINGFLVPERDTSAMADAIDRILNDVALRMKLGENARNFVREMYSVEKFLSNFKKIQ